MSIERAYEVLELRQGATAAEAADAYRDLVSVWHPDRFSHSERLSRKAEEKLKDINRAYEILRKHLEAAQGKERKAGEPTVEHLAEAGTVLVLKAWSRISSGIRKMLASK